MKKIISTFVCLLFAAAAFAQTSQANISTVFRNGEFVTRADTTMAASAEAVDKVAARFIDDYNNDLDALFSWALKGLKLQWEEDDFIMFNIRSHKYDAATGTVRGVMDIYVGMLNQENKDISYRTRLVREDGNGRIIIKYDMTECDKVMECISAVFEIERINENEARTSLEARATLRKPYSFMTMRQYRENIEWRLGKLLDNLCGEMEKELNSTATD